MLVLGRRENERILLLATQPCEMKVQVAQIRGDKVRLGVTAPLSTAVHREEVYDRVQAANGQTPAIAPSSLESFRAEALRHDLIASYLRYHGCRVDAEPTCIEILQKALGAAPTDPMAIATAVRKLRRREPNFFDDAPTLAGSA